MLRLCLSCDRHRLRHLHSAVASGEEVAIWAAPAALKAILVLLLLHAAGK
jgi:hypothetical protein